MRSGAKAPSVEAQSLNPAGGPARLPAAGGSPGGAVSNLVLLLAGAALVLIAGSAYLVYQAVEVRRRD